MNTPTYDRLSAKKKRFVDEYLATWNATRAAEAILLKEPRKQGSRLLTNVDIRAAINEKIQSAAMEADEVLARLAEQARASIGDFLTGDGGGGFSRVQIRRRGHLVKSFTVSRKNGDRLELHDQQAALVHIGKHLGLFVDRTEITGKDGGPITLDQTLQAAVDKIYAEEQDAAADDDAGG